MNNEKRKPESDQNRHEHELIEAARRQNAMANTRDESLGTDPAETIDLASLKLSPGTKIGVYRLLEKIGEGGFGVVYAAEQKKPIRRKVALKIIKPGMDTKQVIARFEAERQALALMDHPNIARVLDAGATPTGHPYFVMELVRGIRITDYCDKQKMPIRQRLELFITICQAIQHAHQKGIIHRDIKPSNVLVELRGDSAVPKIIDFGVAKATNQQLSEHTVHTLQAQMIGTPLYMSPEQAGKSGLDVDTRSDIYSLGVLLYELLTGTTPVDRNRLRNAGAAELVEMICNEDATKPSTRIDESTDSASSVAMHRSIAPAKLRQQLSGELDWIVLKALEKDRTRRYETASGFALDLQRYLSDEPVSAGPPSTTYRLQKFVKRNRGPVFAGVLIALAVVAGLTSTTIFAFRASHQRDLAFENEQQAKRNLALAQNREDETQQVAEFQASQLSNIDAEKMGLDLQRLVLAQVRAIIERSGMEAAVIEKQLEDIEHQLAAANFTDVALETLNSNIFDGALKAIDDQFSSQPLVQARLLQALALTMYDLGLFEQATAPQRKALEIRRAQLGDQDIDTLESITRMGTLLMQDSHRMGEEKYEESLRLLREAVAGRRAVLGNEHPDTLRSINELGLLFCYHGKIDQGEPLLREILETRRRVLGDKHLDTAESFHNFGALMRDKNELDEAETYIRKAIVVKRSLKENNRKTFNTEAMLANVLKRKGNLEEATRYQWDAVEGLRRALGDENSQTLDSIKRLADLLREQRKYSEAKPFYQELVDTRRRLLGDGHEETLTAMNYLGLVLKYQRKHDEAIALLRETLAARRRFLGDDHADTLVSIGNLGWALIGPGQPDEAESLLREALKGNRSLLGDEHRATLVTMTNLGMCLRYQRNYSEAEPLYREVLEIRRGLHGDGHEDTLTAISDLAGLMVRQRKYREAEPLYREVLETRRRVLSDEHVSTLSAMTILGDCLRDQRRYAEAEILYQEALETRRRISGDTHRVTLTLMNRVGMVLRHQKEYAEAESLLREALVGRRRELGDEHTETLNAINYLAALLLTQQKYSEAQPLYQELLDSRRRVLGGQHASTLGSISQMGSLCKSMGNLAEAESYYREAVAGNRARLGDKPADNQLLWSIQNLGDLLRNQRKYVEAELLLRAALEGRRSLIGDKHSITLDTMRSLSDLLVDQEKYTEAARLFQETIQAREKLVHQHPEKISHQQSLSHDCDKLAQLLVFCPDRNIRDSEQALILAKRACELSPDKGTLLNTLGVAQYRAGHFEDAITTLNTSLPLLQKASNLPSPNPIDLAFLAMSHYRLSNEKEAEKYRTQFNESMKLEQINNNEAAQRALKEVNELFDSADKQ